MNQLERTNEAFLSAKFYNIATFAQNCHRFFSCVVRKFELSRVV